jgi:hypothetical protein
MHEHPGMQGDWDFRIGRHFGKGILGIIENESSF